MIKKLKDLFSKRVKKSEPKDEIQVLAYINVAIDKDDQVIIDGDFADNGDKAISKLIFLMCSGALSEWLIDIVHDKCNNDPERADNILYEAHKLITNYIKSHHEDKEPEEDDEPVVDPCNVFKPQVGEEEEEE